jgi:uncharacterized membrane protein YdjX (TVP38/TMEM64 family)
MNDRSFSSYKKSNSRPKTHLPLYISIGLIVGVLICYFFIPQVQEFLSHAWEVLTSDDKQRIKNWVEGFGGLGPVVLVLAMVIQMFLVVIPTVLLMVVTILAYGPIWGSSIVLIAVFTASTVGYLIGKYLGETFVLKLLGKKTEGKVVSFVREYGFWAVVVTRLNPFLSNDAISFVAGISTMKYRKFIGATLLGISPLTALIAYLEESTDRLQTFLLWGSIICLIVFGGYVIWDKRRKKK